MSFSRYDKDGAQTRDHMHCARTSDHMHCYIGACRATHCATGDDIVKIMSRDEQIATLAVML